MTAAPLRRLCLVSRQGGIAGPATFQRRLAEGLAARGIDQCYDLRDTPYAAVLVSGGTRHLGGLHRVRRQGIPIVQRLDGMNWIHRRRRTGARHFLRAEINNLLLRWLRSHLADGVIYQSQFVRRWWDETYGAVQVPSAVVHNGVSLEAFRPGEPQTESPGSRLLVVEASLAGGYETGLEHAISLLNALGAIGRPVELIVAGQVSGKVRQASDSGSPRPITWMGAVASPELPRLYHTGSMLFSADLHPACPNTVIESLACGTPVVAFDTGALPELVEPSAGRLVPYGADAWKLEPPDIGGLAAAAAEVLADLPRYRRGARARAEAAFGLDRMVDGYLAALGWAG
ncbi:MAG: glycosyltransferase family 4 protein [Anaerolineales bacterium]|nr:glycosyltransferase family 4 protein [Anaerolineales bacterium]